MKVCKTWRNRELERHARSILEHGIQSGFHDVRDISDDDYRKLIQRCVNHVGREIQIYNVNETIYGTIRGVTKDSHRNRVYFRVVPLEGLGKYQIEPHQIEGHLVRFD